MKYRILIINWLLASSMLLAQRDPEAARKLEEYKAINTGVQAETIYQQGEELLRSGNYTDAVSRFNQVIDLGRHSLTTAALYLSGLCYYYLQARDKAIERFNQLITQYPQSKFIEEAQYHKALLLLYNAPSDKDGGMYLLLNLIEQTKNEYFKNDVRAAVNHFLYKQADLQWIEQYYKVVRNSFRELVFEAWCYRLYQAGQYPRLQTILNEYKTATNTLSYRLSKFRFDIKIVDKPKELRIALLFPFYANRYDTGVSDISIPALEYFEGIRVAAQQTEVPFLERLLLKVVDVGKDSVLARQVVENDLLTFKPDIIIGGFHNPVTHAITEGMKNYPNALQWIPFSSASELIKNSKQAFLANPSATTQGKKLAEAAIRFQSAHKILILQPVLTPSALELVNAFQEKCIELGRQFTVYKLPAGTEISSDTWQTIRNQIQTDTIEAIFLPVANESLVKQTVIHLKELTPRPKLIGCQDFYRLTTVTKEELSDFEALFPENYYPSNDSNYLKFTNFYYHTYRRLPTLYACHGYDALYFLLRNFWKMMPLERMSDLIHQAPIYYGIQQYYYFPNTNDNQQVTILQYKSGVLMRKYYD